MPFTFEKYYRDVPSGLPGLWFWPMSMGVYRARGCFHSEFLAFWHCFNLVVQGAVQVKGPDGMFTASAAEMFWGWKGEYYEYRHVEGGGEVEIICMDFEGECPDAPVSMLGLERGKASRSVGGTTEARALAERLFDMYKNELPVDPYRIAGIIYEFLAALHGGLGGRGMEDHSGGLVAAARRFMLDHVAGNLNISEVAAALHVSRATLLRAFKRRLNTTPMDDLAKIRLEKAKFMLGSSNDKLAAIAAACGFRDACYFSRCFKAVEGLSPGAWRRRRPERN